MMKPFVFSRPFYLSFKIILIITLVCEAVFAQQINIPRVEMMPNQPSPYEMRDWRQVAQGYDSLVFDLNATGLYLPLIWINPNPINYPNHESFGLDSYVGTFATNSGEAINVLAAVVSASLVGIDKSDQNSRNWVLMSEEFFNRRPAENVYLNNPVTSSGSDWWYDAMPNVFFYQLYDMYPNTGDFAYQFTTVADRWLAAIEEMGGSAAPWHKPYMNYRGWYLESMTPNSSGVPEPEASGALGWLLYHAYKETGAEQYRLGAEWSMEFLSQWTVNPSYELQLPYGAYAAAKMNAELGTMYDVEKIVNWCFEVGSLRQWGVIVGNWGGYDVSGLVGEASGQGHYAFTMNGFEQAGALLPLVRYDDRFARAIAKWTLNVANASRLYYSPYLPPEKQDNEDWAQQYDPNGYIAYEALRREWNGQSPYATGDAMLGGWSATNLGLYGSSHVGIFGGIIDTTNVPMILQLNALKTDYFRDDGYPTYLYFNPYSETKTVQIDLGGGSHDLYDAVSNNFLLTGASGVATFDIPADAAVLAVITPASGAVSYDLDKMLIDGVVVDYRSGQPVSNYPPRIKGFAANPTAVFIGQNASIYCTAEDRDSDPLTYNWEASGGSLGGSGATITWTAPGTVGSFWVRCIVDDGQGGLDSAEVTLEVTDNLAPLITALTATPAIIEPGESTQLTCSATDPNGDTLSYTWFAPAGSFSGSGTTVTWTAPIVPGYFYLKCRVDDGRGGVAEDSVAVTAGTLVAYYPFSGNANDASGFGNHGTVSGAAPVEDRFGNPNSAYYFDGIDDYVRVPNQPSLNFRDAITVNFWMTVGEFFNREAYPISHGNWENRWKISITNKRVRWTVKTDTTVNNGIKDLDSQAELLLDSLYMVTALYDGLNFEIYLNGALNAGTTWGGRILATTIDLAIGQHLPGQNGFNFKGVLDDIRIFNRALTQQEILDLYHESMGILDHDQKGIPLGYELQQNYPNPFNPITNIGFRISDGSTSLTTGFGFVKLSIFDLTGRLVRTLVNTKMAPGNYLYQWNGRDEAGQPVASGMYYYRLQAADFSQTRKMVLLR